jgi:Card1-like endonuclease family protein
MAADRSRTVLITALGDEPLAPLVLARQVGADEVICVGRPVVGWRLPALLEQLRRDGCRASWLPLEAADVPAGLAELRRRLPLSEVETVFDLTNAHGLVGFALYELARQRERASPASNRLVRVDWSDRLMRAISPDRAETQRVEARIELDEFLGLYGKRLLSSERGRGSQGRFGPAGRRIAAALVAARPLLEAVHHSGRERPLRVGRRADTAELIEALAADGLLEWRGGALFPVDLTAFQYLHGRWLEEYLFEVAEASGAFDDCASGLRFRWSEDGGLVNEVDFAATAGGRATIASCKTGFREAAGPLYELLTLAERAAGRSVVAVFATSERLDPVGRQRAAALGIRVLDEQRLGDPERVLETLLGLN